MEGVAELAGTLTVRLPEGEVLSAGASFVVVTATERAGRFTIEDLPPGPAGRELELVYEPDRVLLIVR